MKRFYKGLIAFALTLTLFFGSVQSVFAVTKDSLNNKGDGTISIEKVDSTNNTGSFQVNCAGTQDEVKIFQAATMTWNDSKQSFDDPVWVPEVQTWLAEDGRTYAAYSTPLLLGKAPEATQAEFFKAIVGDSGIADELWTTKWTSDSDTSHVTSNQSVEGENTYVSSYTITDAPLGIYIAVGYATGKTYAPAVAALVPQRDPTGTWYLNQDIAIAMKAIDAYMNKYINGKKTDIVRIGEDVDFSIQFPLPEYTERTMNGTAKEYTLTFDDELSDSFTLDMNSIIVKYRINDGVNWDEIGYGDGQVEEKRDESNKPIAGILDPKYYSSFIAAPAASASDYGMTIWGCSYGHLPDYTIYRNYYKYYNASGSKNDNDGKGPYDNYYAYYYFRDGAYHLLENPYQQNYPELKGYSTTVSVPKTPSATELSGNQVRALYSNKTGDTVNHGWSMYLADGTNATYSSATEEQKAYVRSLFHNIFNITFNYQQLIADSKHNQNLEVQITYQAQVNQNVTVNTETNTNTAIMKYETNSSGTSIGTISDTVKAYTYGLNLVKVDGDTVDSASPTYLDNAKFYIYKETDTFVGTSATDDTTSFYKGAMKDSTTNAGLTIDTSTLAGYKAAIQADSSDKLTNYYFYTYEAGQDETLDNGVAVSTGNVVTRVFKLFTLKDKINGTYLDGTITSKATADGVTIKGLDEGNYIVSEYATPDGYNLLKEDMMFSIYKLSDAEAEAKAGSYAVFANKSDGTDADDDGIYSLKVLNYAGLTLPSTGGMGTLLFTIVGVLLMLTVLVIIRKKGRANMKNAAGFMAILLVAGIVIAANPQNVSAVTEVSLNNEYGKAVTGDNTVNFKVDLKNNGDQLEVYQIGQLTWNEENKTYVGPDWVLGVQNAVAASTEFAAFTTPEKLGAADVERQIAFLNWIYENRGSNSLGQSNDMSSTVTYSSDGMSANVTGVPYGIYLIKASNPTLGKNYQLLTVDALPTKEGPLGAWYMKDNITATLKFSDIIVNKTINGKDGITVTTGETVSFDIVGEVPDYPGVDVVGSDAKDYTGYSFALNDTMSEAFEYDKTTGYTVEYTTEETITESTSWTTLPTDKYSPLFAKAAADKNSSGIRVYKDSLGKPYLYVVADIVNTTNCSANYFAYIAESGTYKQIYTATGTVSNLLPDTISSSNLVASYNGVTGLNTTRFTMLTAAEWKDVMFIDFDYDYLHSQNATNVRVSYKATVTPSMVVGTDNNSNKATFIYQKDLSGSPGSTSDTAYAWTYAMNLIKKDGDKADTYLAGAKFKLYKDAYEYVPTADTADETSGTYVQYTFEKNTDGTMEVPTGIISTEADATAVELTTLDLVNSVQGGDFYFRYVKYAADKCTATNCTKKTAEHSHVIVYDLYSYKDSMGNNATEITSVATADGVTITGLSPASYVLIETQAPTGYNKLQEVLRFEITELTAEQAQALSLSTPDGKDSLRGFASDETYTQSEIDGDSTLKYVKVDNRDGTYTYYKAYTDGIYPIEVKNYAGLVLPSTGGMGTLLFTLIGILLTTTVLVILIVRKRGAKYAAY